jgi:hypothetical protein
MIVKGGVDVVVSTQRVEVVPFVEVERRFIADPAERRVRVGVQVDVVRVVIHVVPGAQ